MQDLNLEIRLHTGSTITTVKGLLFRESLQGNSDARPSFVQVFLLGDCSNNAYCNHRMEELGIYYKKNVYLFKDDFGEHTLGTLDLLMMRDSNSTENDDSKQNSTSVSDGDNSDSEQNPDSITANDVGSIELGDSVYNELDTKEINKTILKKIKNRKLKKLSELSLSLATAINISYLRKADPSMKVFVYIGQIRRLREIRVRDGFRACA
ncbi:hypothetical protein C2G38_2203956 [Gigaspora rosea]|uniref:Uncharacterized protein n=1 Tax=Gigaspora rosea TaxID=44941 RepID=A0A397ULU9_9GLOM|nr:hypothetical protein C2G38_2203956 [Gigaspora rosea]